MNRLWTVGRHHQRFAWSGERFWTI